MTANKTAAQRLGRVLERVTNQSGRVAPTPEYGSWILGRVSESQGRRRIRIQVILTAFVVIANLIGIGVATLVVIVAFPTPSVFDPDVAPITFIAVPIYLVSALVVGVFWATRRVIDNVRWAIEKRDPTREDQRNTFLAPWRLTRVLLALWGLGTVVLTTLYAWQDTDFIPKWLLGISFPGIVVSASCYLFTEFALRPVAAQALEAGKPPRRFAEGLMGRTMLVWALGSGVPVLGIFLAAAITLTQRNLTPTQFTVAVMILALFALVFGVILMWILAWLTVTPVRVVRAALNRVEQGDLDTNLVIFDGTELGQLQRGFNSMVHGLRERERVRDLFGRHVGREVAALAEQERPQLGGEERHAAVIFVDIIGSTKLVTSLPAVEVVDLLNRFFAVDRRRGRPAPRTGQQVRRRRGARSVRGTGVAGASRRRVAGGGARDQPAPARGGARVRGRYRRRGGKGRGRQCRRPGTLRVHRDRRTGQRGRAVVRAVQERAPALGGCRRDRRRAPPKPKVRIGLWAKR